MTARLRSLKDHFIVRPLTLNDRAFYPDKSGTRCPTACG